MPNVELRQRIFHNHLSYRRNFRASDRELARNESTISGSAPKIRMTDPRPSDGFEKLTLSIQSWIPLHIIAEGGSCRDSYLMYYFYSAKFLLEIIRQKNYLTTSGQYGKLFFFI